MTQTVGQEIAPEFIAVCARIDWARGRFDAYFVMEVMNAGLAA